MDQQGYLPEGILQIKSEFTELYVDHSRAGKK